MRCRPGFTLTVRCLSKRNGKKQLSNAVGHAAMPCGRTRFGCSWSTFLASLSTGGIAFHTVAYFTDNTIAPGIAAGALSVMALAGAMGNGLWGALAEQIHPRFLSVATMLISACPVALLTQVRDPFTVYVFAILFGLSLLEARQCSRKFYSRATLAGVLTVLSVAFSIHSTKAAWVSARFLPGSPSTSPVTTEPFLRFSWETIY